ncbi:GreA/GreB family elongation factor (plasmid) [Arthrobacter agilis]|uniref:GreA/GreB family elongation factor n=1 Tax=Arthrobacter agilis TaxID=37921 RepID=UPI0023666F4D|nr:GreA/GreB family elongation factor [Arthrobacter agilis]WDF35109.1 GreA/GreB family elongation factor [Arthrobacter agilis]
METVTWLTPEAHARLQQELNKLLDTRGTQQEVSERETTESRIRQLLATLKNVRLHEPANDGVVEPGMIVEACIDGHPETFLMGSREIFANEDLQVFSERSPLGVAIHGLRAGDVSSYRAPTGRHITVSIISAKPYPGTGQLPTIKPETTHVAN